jgi:Zn finger protein HypA/HybF involved in hydrogenase expression
MTKLECPECHHIFMVDEYDSGDCPNCNKMQYYWDDDWYYIKEEEVCPGFYWERI